MNLLFFFTFLLFLILIGIYKSRKISSEEHYLFAGRNSGILSLTSTLVMTELNTSTLISFASMGYLVGIRALYLPFIFLIGLLFYAFAVAKKWKEFNGKSCCELFSKRYSPLLGKCASICLLSAMTGFNATYVKSLILLFSPLLPQYSHWIISGFLLFLTLLMTIRGGLTAIIRMDVLSFFGTVAILSFCFYFGWKASPNLHLQNLWDTSYFPNASGNLPGTFVFSLIVLTMFTYILAPWYAQKIFSAKSPKIALTSSVLAAFIVFILYSLAVIATSFVKIASPSPIPPESSLPFLIEHFFPLGLKGFAYAILFAAAATTLAGSWSAMSAMIIADFLPKNAMEKDFKRGLIITLFLATSSYILGNTLVDKVFNKLILSNIPIAALSFTLLAGFYWKKASSFGAYLSIVIGISWGFGCFFFIGEGGMYTWHWAIYGIPLIFLSGALGSYLKPNAKATPEALPLHF